MSNRGQFVKGNTNWQRLVRGEHGKFVPREIEISPVRFRYQGKPFQMQSRSWLRRLLDKWLPHRRPKTAVMTTDLDKYVKDIKELQKEK